MSRINIHAETIDIVFVFQNMNVCTLLRVPITSVICKDTLNVDEALEVVPGLYLALQVAQFRFSSTNHIEIPLLSTPMQLDSRCCVITLLVDIIWPLYFHKDNIEFCMDSIATTTMTTTEVPTPMDEEEKEEEDEVNSALMTFLWADPVDLPATNIHGRMMGDSNCYPLLQDRTLNFNVTERRQKHHVCMPLDKVYLSNSQECYKFLCPITCCNKPVFVRATNNELSTDSKLVPLDDAALIALAKEQHAKNHHRNYHVATGKKQPTPRSVTPEAWIIPANSTNPTVRTVNSAADCFLHEQDTDPGHVAKKQCIIAGHPCGTHPMHFSLLDDRDLIISQERLKLKYCLPCRSVYMSNAQPSFMGACNEPGCDYPIFVKASTDDTVDGKLVRASDDILTNTFLKQLKNHNGNHHQSGRKWRNYGRVRPVEGTELTVSPLRAALERKAVVLSTEVQNAGAARSAAPVIDQVEFSPKEWVELQHAVPRLAAQKPLRVGDYVQVGSCFFKPRDVQSKVVPETATIRP